MTAAALPPGLDRLPSGKVRARFRCRGCSQHPTGGGQHSQTFPARGGIRAAQAWQRDQRAAVDSGAHVATSDRRTVAQYAARQVEVNAGLRDSSRSILTQRVAHLDATGLGRQRLQTVTRSDVKAWVADRSAVLAPRTTRALYSFLRSIYAEAVADGIVAASPCVRIAMPEVHDEEVTPLSVEQVRALAAAMPEAYRVGVLVQAAAGLRISELLGLQRSDVDLHRRVIHVRRQLGRDSRTMAPTKTRSSRRTVPLVEPVALALGEHIARHGMAPDQTVLISPHGNPVTHKVYGKHWRRAVAAVEVPEGTTTHDLRHHAASTLIAAGTPVNVVADFLGHSDGGALLLRVYAHLLPDAEDVSRRALDAAWAPLVSSAVSQPAVAGA